MSFDTPKNMGRRRFVRTVVGGLVAAPLAARFAVGDAQAGNLAKVSEDDPAAQALGYVHDATQADTAKFPKRAAEGGDKQFCYNCALYQGAADADWAPCGIFPGKAVAGKGWCNAWAPKG